MRSARRLAGLSIACATTWTLATTVLHAGRQGVPEDTSPPTAIEEALIEHACGALRPAGAPETDAYLACRQNRLVSLRNDFGRDLKRLSNAERRAIDSACNALRAPRGQDAYVECLALQLASLRGRGSRARPAGAADAAPPSTVAPPVEPPPPPPPASRLSSVSIGAAVLALVAAAGGAFVVLKSRRSLGTCRTCGVKLAERGELCQKCRHEAAEALRRAKAERADQARAEEEEQRRRAEREEEQRQQQARDEEARRRQQEEAQKEQARQQELQAQRQREEETRRQRQADAAANPDELDPYAVLGLAQGASVGEIEDAYQAARSKYDMELVADLGVELQEHFKRKAQVVERAYEILASRRPQ